MPRELPFIDDDIYAFLQSQAVPLEDDVNTVLRRLLGLDQPKQDSAGGTRTPRPTRRRRTANSGSRERTATPRRKRAAKGSILAEEAYEAPILRALVQLGERAPTREVVDLVGEFLDGQLTGSDYDVLSSGDVRWRNRAQFVRLSLIKRGDMKEGSPRGLWEISEQGRQRLQRETS
jgi:hypothetical protein